MKIEIDVPYEMGEIVWWKGARNRSQGMIIAVSKSIAGSILVELRLEYGDVRWFHLDEILPLSERPEEYSGGFRVVKKGPEEPDDTPCEACGGTAEECKCE